MGLMAALFFTNAPRVLSAMTLFTKAPSEAQPGVFVPAERGAARRRGPGSLMAAHLISGKRAGASNMSSDCDAEWAGILLGLVLCALGPDA